jgi:hypothetical protein
MIKSGWNDGSFVNCKICDKLKRLAHDFAEQSLTSYIISNIYAEWNGA